jgi:hypothetical protein
MTLPLPGSLLRAKPLAGGDDALVDCLDHLVGQGLEVYCL